MEEIPLSQKIFNYVSWITIFSAGCLIILFGYWYIYPITPIIFELPFKVENKEVKSGDYLFYLVKYCKNTKVIPIISKTFVDGVTYTVQQEPAVENKVGCGERRIAQYVPKALPLGKYHISITYHYQMNPVRYIDVVAKTEEFTIIK